MPAPSSATAGADPTVAQRYDYLISPTPTMAASPTPTSLGVIGVMISGASLFNPYEADGTTVATQSNFSVKNAQGNDVWFLDDCSGHPTPTGQYHYHALPKCVTAPIDETKGASHILGIELDGFPIYGDRNIDGEQLTAAQLDECNGITSVTPESPMAWITMYCSMSPTSPRRSAASAASSTHCDVDGWHVNSRVGRRSSGRIRRRRCRKPASVSLLVEVEDVLPGAVVAMDRLNPAARTRVLARTPDDRANRR